jgi:hypothetical protein
MSAELLRRAAKVLRDHATEAIGGEWVSLDAGDRLISTTDDGASYEYILSEEPARHGETADYIALMHPPVAHAMADLLDEVAESVEQDGGVIQDSTTAGAVDLARAILREES